MKKLVLAALLSLAAAPALAASPCPAVAKNLSPFAVLEFAKKPAAEVAGLKAKFEKAFTARCEAAPADEKNHVCMTCIAAAKNVDEIGKCTCDGHPSGTWARESEAEMKKGLPKK